MSVDLLLSQSIPQNSSSGVQSCKIGPSGQDRSSKIQSTQESYSSDDDNFLATLKNVSQDRTATKQPHEAVKSKSGEATVPVTDDDTVPVTGDENDEAIGHITAQDDISTCNEEDADSVQIVSDWMAIINILENVGHDNAPEGRDLRNMVDINPVDDNQLTTLKALIARLQQHHQVPPADLKAGVERLQQFIANALGTKVLMPLDQNSGKGFSPNQLTELVQINQWLKELTSGIQEPKSNSGLNMGRGDWGATLSVTVPAVTMIGAETAERSLDMDSSVRETGSPKLAADTRPLVSNILRYPPAVHAVENAEADTRPLVSNILRYPPAVHAVENAEADTSRAKESLGFLLDNRTLYRTKTADRMASMAAQDQHPGNAKPQDSQLPHSSASSGINPGDVKVSECQNQSITGAGSLPKVYQENQLVKEGVFEVETGKNQETVSKVIIEETVSKVIKTEASTHDNGLLNSSGSNTDKFVEIVSSSKETETSQNTLRNSTMGQIVHKAAMHLGNGQHKARIDLKPEFLGHIRMQVISENQQVTVKILAQHGFVKDMIESNVHQLKADLQMQGLEVDKFEVSVSRDPEDSGNSKEKFAQSRTKQSPANHKHEERPNEEQQKDTGRSLRSADGALTVDYFA